MSINPLGLVLPAAGIGFGALLIKPRRGFFIPASDGIPGPPQPIIAQATLEERHFDELEITDHPVEQGAAITDHAFKRPAEVIIRCGWSNSPSKPGGFVSQAVGIGSALGGSVGAAVAAIPSTAQAAQSLLRGNDQGQVKLIYEQLLKLQDSRIPFDVYTGKRSYKNMLLKSITVETDEKTENILMVTAVCKQVLLVTTRVVSLVGPPESQASPEKTGSVLDQGARQLIPGNFGLDLGSFSGALSGLTDSISAVQETLALAPDGLLTMVSGPISNVGGILDGVTSSVSGVMSQLPLPLEIPMISEAAQKLSVGLSGVDLSGALGTAIDGLPDLLTNAQSAVTKTIFQLPSLESILPSSMEGLADQLGDVSSQINNSMKQITRVLTR